MKITTGIISAALVAAVAVLIVYSFDKRLSQKRGNWPDSPLLGKPAPDFSLKLFDGKTFELKDISGKSAVLNFWASWCLPCADEAEEINKAERVYGGEVIFAGVNVMDDMEDAFRFVAKHKIKYPNGYDPEKTIHIDYGVAGVPETFFIGADGKIARKISGPVTFAEISETLDSLAERRN